MADTYTKADVSDTHDKDVPITHAWSEDKTEGFTIRNIETRIAQIDSQVAGVTAEKVELEAKIAEAERVLAE